MDRDDLFSLCSHAGRWHRAGAGRVTAGRESPAAFREECRRECPDGRKVRAPRGTMVGNAHRPRGQGKCHREQTAGGASAPQARVKR